MLRGVLLRLAPAGTASDLLWVALVLVVAVAGFALSARLDRLDEQVAVVAAVGMVAFLISPVSWVHHLFWGVVVVGALLGDGRDRRRLLVAVAGAAMLWMRLPWWGVDLLASHRAPQWAGRVLQSGYTVFAVLALIALWWLVARAGAGGAQIGAGTPSAAAAANTASSAQTAAPARRTVPSDSHLSNARPISAPAAETSSNASQAPANTDTGSS